MEIRKIAALKTPAQFLDHLARLNIHLPFDPQIEPAPSSPLAQPAQVDGLSIPNRWCVLPMEGWDGTPDGRPSELTRRRWQRFGLSGAGLVWGGEAVAVRHDGRANPNQLVIRPDTLADLSGLRADLVAAYRAGHRQQRQPGDRPPADPLGPFFSPQRQSARTAPGLRPPLAQSAFRPPHPFRQDHHR